MALDKDDAASSSGEGLEAVDPGTGEEIEKTGLADPIAEDCKGAFAHGVRGGSNMEVFAGPEEAARAPFTTGDPHCWESTTCRITSS
jgi:hypothetical protein